MAEIIGRARPLRQSTFQKILGEVLGSEAEGDRRRKDHASECDSKADGHDITGDAELFERHGDRDELDAPSGGSGDDPSRR